MTVEDFIAKAKEYGWSDEWIQEEINDYNGAISKGTPTLPLGHSLTRLPTTFP